MSNKEANVRGKHIFDNARVLDEAVVWENAVVRGKAVVFEFRGRNP
jgi:carbonic anhydrase/acetyltransferase-like protein (isoleucine patch superfamily)